MGGGLATTPLVGFKNLKIGVIYETKRCKNSKLSMHF